MNDSGKAIAPFLRKHRINPENILVIYDDLDIPLGRVRLRKNGGSGGHNGIKSIIESIQSESFNRLRIGIGKMDSSEQIDHVLGNFAKEENKLWQQIVELSSKAVKTILFRGFTQAMNSYNGQVIEIKEDIK